MSELEKDKEELDELLREVRAERYAMQSVAKKALPKERVTICLRNRIKKRGEDRYEDIKIWKHRQTNKAFYSGLAVCGSVWNCPVCASKITEKRSQELKQAFAMHKKEGGQLAMLTLTFSHQKTDRLEDILSRFGQATEKFMSGKRYQKIREELGLIGRVRATEVKYGENGFHPHLHIALFYTNDEINLSVMEFKMYELWKKACEKFGLKTNFDYGIDLQKAEDAEDYFTKQSRWTMDKEFTKWHVKKGKKDSLMPFDFLRLYIETEEEKYLRLFQEYAQAFKGKRQLQWSKGLKQKFIVEEKTDEQLAKEKTEEADVLGILNFEQWKFILRTENRSYFLDLCETYGFDNAIELIEHKRNNEKQKKNLQGPKIPKSKEI